MQSSIYEKYLVTYIRGGKASKRSFTVATSSSTKEAWMLPGARKTRRCQESRRETILLASRSSMEALIFFCFKCLGVVRKSVLRRKNNKNQYYFYKLVILKYFVLFFYQRFQTIFKKYCYSMVGHYLHIDPTLILVMH